MASVELSTAGPEQASAERMPPAIWIGCVGLIACLIFQRIVFNAGGYPFPVALFVVPPALIFLAYRGVAKIDPVRAFLFLAIVITGLISTLLNSSTASVTALGLFFIIYAFFLFRIEVDEETHKKYVELIVNAILVICVIGVLQFLIQFAFRPQWLFSWKTIFPKQFILEYNTLNTLFYRSPIIKANGFFLLEPSTLSQLAARGLILALVWLKRPTAAVIVLPALLCAFSGTGILLALAFALPAGWTWIKQTKPLYVILALLLLVIAAAIVLGNFEALSLDRLLGRTAEFGNQHSSGYARFVAPFIVSEQITGGGPWATLFGAGPGAVDRIARALRDQFDVHQTAWFKLFADFGLFGLISFGTFITTCFWQSTRSVVLTAALTVQYLLLAGNISVPQLAFLALIIGGLVYVRPPLDKGQRPTTQPAASLGLRGAG